MNPGTSEWQGPNEALWLLIEVEIEIIVESKFPAFALRWLFNRVIIC